MGALLAEVTEGWTLTIHSLMSSPVHSLLPVYRQDVMSLLPAPTSMPFLWLWIFSTLETQAKISYLFTYFLRQGLSV